MKKTPTLLLAIFMIGFSSNLILAQELNQAFLNSLPKSIQEDFLSSEDDDMLTDNFNDRPETRIQKIESGIDSIKDQIRTIESQINREEGADDLIVFGSDFFSSYQSSFSPTNQQNFSSDYVLDVGDILTIQTVGNLSINKKVNVSRDGTINIPNVGIIFVAGLSYEKAIQTIEEYVAKKFLGIEVFVNLESARDMSVLLVGNAEKPGIYTLPGGSNILSLLHAAGGINENGSYRTIFHKRNSQIIQTIDLYDVLIKGNLSFISPLRSGDSVVIGSVKRLVAISGGINASAIYELKDGEYLKDIISFAGGLAEGADEAIIISKANGDLITLAIDKALSLDLNHGDSVKVALFSPLPQKISTVTLSGAVKKPGIYSFDNGTTLHEIISKAGGYHEAAYPHGGALYRKRAAEMQKEIFEKTYNALINYLASGAGTGGLTSPSNQNLQTILAELKASEFKGRLSAEFSPRMIADDPSLDTVLVDGDKIHIPFFVSDVYVAGDVLNPGGRRYSSNSSAFDYINESGGLSRFADKDRIIIIKPDGNAAVVKPKRFAYGAVDPIPPGSTIYIPKEIGKIEGIAYTATLAPIISSLALSLASLNSIK